MRDIVLVRKPILDVNQDLVAFELRFRTTVPDDTGTPNDMSDSANVIAHGFGEFGAHQVLGMHKGFIGVDAEVLNNDLAKLLPKDQVVLELLDTLEITPEVIARCHELCCAGFSLAVDSAIALRPDTQALLPLIKVVRIDLLATSIEQLGGILDKLRSWPVQLLAANVDTHEQAKTCSALGFHLVQGYYFARPQLLEGRRADPSLPVLLKLLSLIATDADVSKIEDAIKPHPNLGYHLLRMVNSVACGLHRPVGSLRQALAILGFRQLQRWVTLMLFTINDSGRGLPNPLLQVAALRGRMMEVVAKQEQPGNTDYQAQAFMTGILSLLEVLMGLPLAKIMAEMPLSLAVKSALLARTGALGRNLSLAEAVEAGDETAISAILQEFSLNRSDLSRIELQAIVWTNTLTQPAS